MPLSKVDEHFDALNAKNEAEGVDKFEEVNDFFDDIISKNNAPKAPTNPSHAPGSTRSLTKIINHQAESWGMPADTYAQFMDEVMSDEVARLAEREQVKKELRDRLGLNAGDFRRMQNKGGQDGRGGDYAHLPLDAAADDFAANYPHFFTTGNNEKAVWDLVIEGKQTPPSKISRAFHDKVDAEIQNRVKASGNNYRNLMSGGDFAPDSPTTDDGMPF